ncbi:MAG TPA: sterol desaturase family protein [Microthrixaceae bacterium]|jgi:uncharacterized membrane protein|nr:sterol desaturase family protein [Microthrixaceae bacterium]HQF93462.1 sterol desaturase family protein [Microthrixaceae bacterium]
MASTITLVLTVVGSFVGGAFLWTLGEYVLHSSFHWAKGKGFASRAHLDHHVHASWHFDPIITLAWLGVVLFGVAYGYLGSLIVPASVSYGVGAGWTVGYFFYEWHHRASHLRGPRNRWERWVRINHFNHHFGHPMMNQQVSIPLWDIVFRTYYTPDIVKVPRRLAMPWLFDDEGNLKAEYAADYEIVGDESTTNERKLALDKARAYANLEPVA